MSLPPFDGLLVLDKPAGITSRDAVDRALTWFPRGTRIGHTGTLDPLATGVLVLCLGSATRLVEYVQDLPKVYASTFRLGAISDTDDAAGVIEVRPDAVSPERARIDQELAGFVGTIDQVPPAFSAAHVGGRRAHVLARQGQPVSLAPRPVTVYSIDVNRYEFPWLDVEVRCGKGTYIRSLARDLGERLGIGGLVQTLRRTRVGPFQVADALSLEVDRATARAALRPPIDALAGLPRLTLDEAASARLRQGQRLRCDETLSGTMAVVDVQDGLVAIAEAVLGTLKPLKVWNRAQN